MAKLIDGKQIAETIKSELKVEIREWTEQGHRPPQLTAVLLGEDPASSTYVNNKMKVSERLSMRRIFGEGFCWGLWKGKFKLTFFTSIVQKKELNSCIKK